MEYALRGLLSRRQSLGIRQISYEITVHIHRDPGIYNTAHDFLRIYLNKYKYALVLLDKEGCGSHQNANTIAQEIQSRMNNSGWGKRSKVIVIDPELEIWVWSDSPEVSACIGWNDIELRNWLHAEGYLLSNVHKPSNPKLVFETALKLKRKPRSSSIYGKLAERVGFDRCADMAFQNLKASLQNWFPNSS